jgi:hypothetical protein
LLKSYALKGFYSHDVIVPALVNFIRPVALEDYSVGSRGNFIAVLKLPRPAKYSNLPGQNLNGGTHLKIRGIVVFWRRFPRAIANDGRGDVPFRTERGYVLKGIMTLGNVLIRPNLRRGRIKARVSYIELSIPKNTSKRRIIFQSLLRR